MEHIFVVAMSAGVAAFAAAYASTKFSLHTLASNRAAEFPENEKSQPLSASQKDWTLVHIRDDLGAIHNLIVLANGLLAAILTVLIVR